MANRHGSWFQPKTQGGIIGISSDASTSICVFPARADNRHGLILSLLTNRATEPSSRLQISCGIRLPFTEWKQAIPSQPVLQEFHSPLLGCISSFIGTCLTHERPTRPISKAEALGWETGSTFCSRGQDRQLAHRL